LLIDKDCFLTVGDILSHEDFYNEANSKIYEVMFDLYRTNKPIDLITVKEKLEDKKLLDKVGGMTYLMELTEIVPTTSNVFEYAQIVKNKAVLRNLIKAGNQIISC
jgi:replicative DNA helicase